jgi:tRNA 2-thiocytidine biosynthesis protein TtcA
VIYRVASEVGANKIALGHHRDDIVETLFLNLFFSASMKSMPPKLATNNKQHIVIRPLAYCSEKDIAAYARQMQFPIIPCDLCGSQPNLQRQKVKQMLRDWEIEQPGRVNNIFRSICNVDLARLGDTNLYDFKNLTQAKADDEDPLFDSAEENDQINAVLNLIKSEGSRIEFVRNGK